MKAIKRTNLEFKLNFAAYNALGNLSTLPAPIDYSLTVIMTVSLKTQEFIII